MMSESAHVMGEGGAWVGPISLIITLATLLMTRSKKSGEESKTQTQNTADIEALTQTVDEHTRTITAHGTQNLHFHDRIKTIEATVATVKSEVDRAAGRDEGRRESGRFKRGDL